MKKLNRKGFTLIELLAIIVILSIILVVTIPTVLSSIGTARQKSYENAIATIEDYLQQEYDKCIIGDAVLANWNTGIFVKCNGKCKFAGTTPSFSVSANTTIVTAAGYTTTDIASISATICDTGKIKVTAAPAGSNGKFNGVTAYSVTNCKAMS